MLCRKTFRMPNLRDQGTHSGTFHADMQQLKGLSPTLGSLAIDADELRGELSGQAESIFGQPNGAEPAVAEAQSIHEELVEALLLAAVKERLAETGEIMLRVAETYRAHDDDKRSTMASTAYTKATGEWDIPEVPQ